MNHEERHAAYSRQGPTATPARIRRLRKKARRDVLAWAKSEVGKSHTPDGEQPSDATFEMTGWGKGAAKFDVTKGLDSQLARVARRMLTTAWFRFRGDPKTVEGIMAGLVRRKREKRERSKGQVLVP